MKLNRLLFISIFSGIGYLGIYLIGWYKFWCNDGYTPPINPRVILFLFIASLWLVFTNYLLYCWRKKINWQKSINYLIFGTVIFCFILIAAWPLTSTDIFLYIMQGRVLGLYHDNPYVTYISSYPQDPLQQWVFGRWANMPMVYGPAWGLISGGLSFLINDNIVTGLFVYRFFLCLIFFLSIWLVYKILSRVRPEAKYWGTFLYAWNPLILFEIANNGHNDIIMVALVLLALYLFLEKKYLAVLPVIFLACLVKYVFVLIAPFVLLTLWPLINKKIKFLIINSLAGLALLMGCLVFFDWGQGLTNGLLYLNSFYWEFNLSFLPALFSSFFTILLPHFNRLDRMVYIKFLCTGIFIVFYGYLLIKYYQSKNFVFEKLNAYIIYIISGYFFIACFSLNEWFLLWLMPWLLFFPSKKYLVLFFCLTLTGLITSNVIFISLVFVMVVAIYIIFNTLYYAFKKAFNINKIP